MRRAHALALVALAACQSAASDPYPQAQDSVGDGDLLQALTQLDKVWPAHPQYAQARAMASAIERRMRASHRLLAVGLSLRAQWRDDDAVEYFNLALRVWPKLHGAREMIAATQNRMRALDPAAGSAGQATTEQTPDDLAVTTTTIVDDAAPAPIVEVPKPTTSVSFPARVAEAERLLQRGRLERALDLLEELYAIAPHRARVRDALVRTLHLRALLNYGQGDLELAITDWTRVLELDPRHRIAEDFRGAAAVEQQLGATDADR